MKNNASSQIPYDQWPSPDKYRKSIKTEFLLFVGVIMIVLMLILGYIVTNKYVKTVTGHVVKELIVQARSASGMAGNHIISSESPDRLMLGDICAKLASDNSDIYWVGITGNDSLFIAHTDIGMVVAGKKLPEFETDRRQLEVLGPYERYISRLDTIFLTIPITEGKVNLGTLAISASTQSIQNARSSSIRMIGLITLGLMVLGIPGTLLMVRHKLRPIGQITQGLRDADLDKLTFPIPHISRNEFGYLADTLRTMGQKLYQAKKELLEKTQMERELQIAREIQSSILPTQYPNSDRYAFSGMYQSAREVGGDYYDFIDYDSDHIGFLVADVSGKSLPAMLIMLLTRDIVRKVTASIKEPAQVLAEINHELFGSITGDSFVSMFFALMNKMTGDVKCASAGHTSLLYIDGATGDVNRIKTKGYPLGLEDNSRFTSRIESADLHLSQGDCLVMHTDGITEAINAEGEQFGLQRLMDESQANRHFCSEKIVKNIISQHRKFVGTTLQFDDITLLSLKWDGVNSTQTSDITEEYNGAIS
jgi:serine phosphatase RsbU (regulator of sigma subunit)